MKSLRIRISEDLVLPAEAVTRFWAKVERGPGCWLWLGGLFSNGYGSFAVTPKKTTLAHRFAYVVTNAPIPSGMVLRHSCDTKRCVRTDHLSAGTTAQNVGDRVARGRSATGDRNGSRTHPESLRRGDAHPNSKLTAPDV